MKRLLNYFSKGEILLWGASVLFILLSFCIYDRENYFTLIASLIGVTSLIFSAKGNPFGPLLMIVFSVLYGIISLSVSYYGEMITYLGMTAPMAIFALVSWLKNPFQGNKSEVTVNKLKGKELVFMVILTVAVTIAFKYILEAFNTANIVASTISIATSFLGAYLTFRRSEYFALAYAANDIVLIVMWIMATAYNSMYLSVVVCFGAFLVNDLYGYISWKRMHLRQSVNTIES